MTEPAELLGLLADINEPDLRLGLLLAPGHWLLLGLIVLLFLFVTYRVWRNWKKHAAKRQAWREFGALEQTDPELATKLNVLLKRLLKSYWPQHPILSASTKDWQQHWQQQLPQTLRLPELAPLLYQPATAEQSAARQQLYQCAKAYLQAFNIKKLAPEHRSNPDA